MKVSSANRLLLAAGIFCVLLGAMALVGWHAHLSSLLQIVPGDVAVHYNTALAFILCGVACIAISQDWNVPARLLSGVVALLGATTLVEHLLKIDLHIDQVFQRDTLADAISTPGRMSHTTAFCFLLAGLSLLILAWGRPGYRRPFVSAAIGAGIFALAMASMTEYLLGMTTATGGNTLVEMAFPVAGGFLVLSAGILHTSWRGWSYRPEDTTPDAGFISPLLMRPWAPIFMTGIAAVLSICVWRALVIKQDTEIRRSVGIEVGKAEDVLQSQLAARAMALSHLSQHWDIYGTPTQSSWMAEAKLLTLDMPGWQAITMVDATGRIDWVYPTAPNVGAVGYNVFAEPVRRTTFREAQRTGSIVATPQITFVTGGKGFLLAAPIFMQGQFDGFLNGVFRCDTVFDSVLPDKVTRGFAVAVEDGVSPTPLWTRMTPPVGPSTTTDESFLPSRTNVWEQQRTMDFYGLHWRVRVQPTPLLLQQQQSSIPGIALGLGLLFAGLVGATTRLAQTARMHSLYIGAVNKQLEREIAERLEYMRQVEVERENALKGWAETERQSALLTTQAQELKRSNESLTEFASIASHDLKEPLRKIQTFGDMLRRRASASMDADATGYLDRMTGAAQRMQTLIDGLLDYSRASTRPPELGRVDLGEVVRGVVGDLEARLADSNGRVVFENLPTLKADPVQMRQLFQNLIGNALKFRRADVPSVVTIKGYAENGIAHITVADNGIGFEPKFADRIFRIFERLESTSRFEGTGIGLAICRTIVDRYHGTIRASAVLGEGATFTIELPCALPDDAAA